MRIAFVDLMFAWPPRGGADVDLFHVVRETAAAGHEVRVFAMRDDDLADRPGAEPDGLPFPAELLDLTGLNLEPRTVAQRYRRAVDAWRPDSVFLGDGFFLKPYVGLALAHHPLVSRYYAYEVGCPRDHRLFLNGAPCPMDYLRTPEVCRPCALAGMADLLKPARALSWPREFLAARAYRPAYHALQMEALSRFPDVIVSNRLQQSHLLGYPGRVHVVPGGVDMADWTSAPPPERDRKVLFMAGRIEDPLKGFSLLREAVDRLARSRADFEVWVTHPDESLNAPHIKAIGWRSGNALRSLYREADIAVVPSIWEEPFGLVAVEAMASSRPVCAARVGGLQEIVVDGETGLLFDRNDAPGLTACLDRLLDDAALRRRMGEAGRTRAEAEYDWRRIVEKHYLPIFKGSVQSGAHRCE